MRKEVPIVVRKDGDMFVPKFPVELEAGDQLIIVREMWGSQVPEGEKWTVSGYSDSGPVITSKS